MGSRLAAIARAAPVSGGLDLAFGRSRWLDASHAIVVMIRSRSAE
jgi:hypothetical protein